MEHVVFQTRGVCARQIEFDRENGKVYNVQFLGGCNGNLKAISKLVEGMEEEKIVSLLKGNTCGPKPTSCADQLATAVQHAMT